jgi:hypothetical protein
MVPPGVALAMVGQARREEDHDSAAPYFDALEAEARLLAGDPATALTLARHALDKLPRKGEALLRGRTAAVAAEAAGRLGRNEDARGLWSQALAEFPAAPLVLGLSLPVRVETDGSPSAHALADRLLGSPRLRAEASGLPLRLRAAGGNVVAVLDRADGQPHLTMESPFDLKAADAVADACDQFHALLAAPALRLSAADVNALDGVPGPTGLRGADAATLAAVAPQPAQTAGSGSNDPR